jgi:hypothetical protein
VTTVRPLTPTRRRRRCTRCHGPATHVIVKDGKPTLDVRCTWCKAK